MQAYVYCEPIFDNDTVGGLLAGLMVAAERSESKADALQNSVWISSWALTKNRSLDYRRCQSLLQMVLDEGHDDQLLTLWAADPHRLAVYVVTSFR